jgi:peptidoglycan hydrolase-like protein with peptidoglycan-binding domain
MQRIRLSLIGSTLIAALASSGVALAGDEHSKATHSEAAHIQAQTASPGPARTLAMQRALAARNLYQGKADGVWGPKTEAALRNFQTQNGLTASGELNPPTAEKLGLVPERQPVAGSDAPVQKLTQPQLEDASTNVQLNTLSTAQGKEMQQRLQLLGYYRGPIDGAVGEGTREALQRFFQRQAELAEKGVVSNAAIGLFGTEPNDLQPVKGTDSKGQPVR